VPEDDRHSKTILAFLDRDPFVPFQIVMNSGDRITIESPGFVLMKDGWLTCTVPHSNSVVQLRLNQLCMIQIEDLWDQRSGERYGNATD